MADEYNELFEHNRVNPTSLGDEEMDEGGSFDDGSERVTEVQGIIRRSLEQAIDYYQETLEPEQIEATDYYHGRPFGDEEEGRSQVVSTDLRDTTLSQLPGLLRTFFSAENP